MVTLLTIVFIIYVHFVNGNDRVCRKKDGTDTFSIQRQKSKNPLSYDPDRTPSYCDRIVFGSIDLHLKSQIQVHEYTAITDKYIDYSDHDLVYGYFSFDGMNILTVTWNVGKFVEKSARKDQNAWDDILCSLKTSLNKHIQTKRQSDNNQKDYPNWDDIDIFAIGFQEAKWPFKLSYLTKSLRKSFEDKMSDKKFHQTWKQIIEHEGPGLLSARNTYLYILYNQQRVYHNKKHRIVQKIIFNQGSGFKKGFKKLIRTKSAVVIGRFRKIIMKKGKRKISNSFIAFGNAHLPVDTKNKKDWGVKVREEAMNDVRDKFVRRFDKNDNDKGLIVFMGDLNFRVINPNDAKERFEQLEMYLDDKGKGKNIEGFWKEIMSIDDEQTGEQRFLPTCKRETGSWMKQINKVKRAVSSRLVMGNVRGWIQKIAKHVNANKK